MDIKVKEEVLDVHEDDSDLILNYDIVKEETTIQEINVPVQREETATNEDLVNFEITEIKLKVEPKEEHTCEICGKTFQNAFPLKRHMLVHSKNKKFQCTICLKTFKYKTNLHVHEKTHNEDPIPCSICKTVIKHSYGMRSHMKKQHGSHKKARQKTIKFCYECEKCGKKLSNKINLRQHIKRMHVSFVERKPLIKPENTFPCKVCNKRFKLKQLLQLHQETHFLDKEAQFKCIYCTKSYQKQSALQAHMKAHHRGLPKVKGATPKCSICKKVYENIEDLKKHAEEIHPGRSKRSMCECAICGLKTKCKITIERHIMRVHLRIPDTSNRKDTTCPVCSISLARRYLKGHLTTHSQNRPFGCDTCDKRYKTKAQLKLHKSYHVAIEKNQAMKCKYCERIFYLKNTLYIHSRDHHRGLPVKAKDPPFTCTVCQKSYDILDELKKHVVIHKINLNCEICGKAFSTETNLKRHVRNVHQRQNLPKESSPSNEILPD